jgi:uncharacterized radical SAM superfamily Fe-S cluster-containing enzyme
MAKPFQVAVFGKVGCDKCKVLLKRVDDLLAKPEWADFERVYLDVETVDGLVEFCKAECLNPQRVPAMVVRRVADGGVTSIPADPSAAPDPVLGASRLYHMLGLQTDYSDQGRGVISPRMITSVSPPRGPPLRSSRERRRGAGASVLPDNAVLDAAAPPVVGQAADAAWADRDLQPARTGTGPGARRDASPVSAWMRHPSMVDWPGHMAGVLLVTGCNFRCPFCHNAPLLAVPRGGLPWADLAALCRRFQGHWVDAIVVSGGEPTLQAGLPDLIDFLRARKFHVKARHQRIPAGDARGGDRPGGLRGDGCEVYAGSLSGLDRIPGSVPDRPVDGDHPEPCRGLRVSDDGGRSDP